MRDAAGGEWLVKFPKPDDLLPETSLEAVWLSVAQNLGIPVATSKRLAVLGGEALAMERFDRDSRGRPLHYLSAHALLNIERARVDDPRFSYREIAHRGRRFVENPEAFSRALYRRMAFNAIGGNTDDHLRNHGFLFDPMAGVWNLAPAFDLVPQLSNPGRQALAVGQEGRAVSIQNLLSESGHFGLSEQAAAEILRTTAEAFLDIEVKMRCAGVSTVAARRVEAVVAGIRTQALKLPAAGRDLGSAKQHMTGPEA